MRKTRAKPAERDSNRQDCNVCGINKRKLDLDETGKCRPNCGGQVYRRLAKLVCDSPLENTVTRKGWRKGGK